MMVDTGVNAELELELGTLPVCDTTVVPQRTPLRYQIVGALDQLRS